MSGILSMVIVYFMEFSMVELVICLVVWIMNMLFRFWLKMILVVIWLFV